MIYKFSCLRPERRVLSVRLNEVPSFGLFYTGYRPEGGVAADYLM